MTIQPVVRFACGLLLGLVCFVSGAVGQTESATVSGLITDSTGAVVPGAEVKLQSVDRGTTTSATTNNIGIYVFASVHPGPYQITVQKPGFKQVDFLGLMVNVQDHIEQNFRLQVGSVSESVTVTGNELNVNTTDATVSTVVDRNFAENLPMNGRSFQTLIQLTPGVVTVPSNSQDGGQFSINGQRSSSNYWTVDGVSANIGIGVGSSSSPGNGFGGALASFSASGGTNSLVSIDALQEFRIQTSTYAPEFGRTPGGQISIVTRSGGNQIHGTVFDYLRNDILDSNNWFANNAGLAKPKERQNDFGGTFSGPVVKDHTFFFFSYEGLRLRLPQTVLTTVPDANPSDPLARQNAKPAMQPYLNAYPLPNGPQALDALGNPIPGAFDFNASFSNPSTLDAYSLRIDHKLADKLTLFGRYNYSPSEIVQRGGSTSAALSVLQSNRIETQTGTLGATWLKSTSVANETRFNYSRVSASGAWNLDGFGGAVPIASPPFPAPLTSKTSSFLFMIYPSLANGGALQVGRQGQNLQRQINLVDNLSVQHGTHNLKFGIDYRRLTPQTMPASYQQDVFFADVPSAQTGSSELGAIASGAPVTALFRNLGAFAQDTWRFTPRLTMTYGLRWDIDFAPSSLKGPSIPALEGYDPNNLSNLGIAASGTPPFKTTYGNVAPRVGIAFDISQTQDWQTVFRGGFGVFYDLVSSETGTSIGVGDPPFGTFGTLSGTFPFTPQQIMPLPIPPATLSSIYAFNPRLLLPYTLEWNVSFEQTLGRGQSISASYIGASGRRLIQATDIQGPPTNPAVNGVFVDNTAASSYNALQLQFQRRLLRGLQALASYSWSHSIDTGSAGSTALASNINVPGSNRDANRGPSDFDLRNAVSAGVTYQVPAPGITHLTNMILEGWSVQSIIQARSGAPVNISDSNFFFFNGGIFADVRPDIVPGQPVYLQGRQYPSGKALNPSAFTNPPVDPNTGNPLRQGNVPRNFARGFGATQWDFAIHREFPVHESLRLEFRAEMFNVLNHPNFGPPNGQFGAAGFGLSSQTLAQYLNGGGNGSNVGGGAFSALYQMGGPRSIQFALKLTF